MQTKVSNVLISLMLAVFSAFAVNAQMQEPVKWDIKFAQINETEATITFKATIDAGWHLYGLMHQMPEGAPVYTDVIWDIKDGVELIGNLTADRVLHTEHDANFDMDMSWWSDEVVITQKLKVTEPTKIVLKGSITGMTCNDVNCMQFDKFFNLTPKFKSTAKKTSSPVATSNQEEPKTSDSDLVKAEPAKAVEPAETTENVATAPNSAFSELWTPVIEMIEADEAAEAAESGSLLYIFFAGFLGGLVALFTPCVWPLIPMTVSFFLKKNKKSRRKAISEATIYGVSIIVIYVLLGLLVTVLFGASKLNELSTNAVFNIAFFLLLVLFGVSFLGAFDIKLPSSWANKMDASAETATGYLSIFFMAFTLALVSFSCTGPIIGTLLVEAATSGSYVGPAIGMFGFALALAIPFSLFAIFPSVLQSAPKSGGWLNSVKVVLGFLELALSLKFLSVADLAYGWHILDREVFIVLWVVIFALLGVYLLGKLRFEHDDETPKIGVFRFFLATISLSFALYLVPGLWGAPLKMVSAFVPPLYTQDFNLYEGNQFKVFDDYEEGMAYAKEHNMPVLMDFSGYGCVNCRKMEAAVFDNPQVRQMIEKDFVLIELMVDDKSRLPETIMITENGTERPLRTVGDRWSYLQRYKFGANSQPYYIILDEKGMPMSNSHSYDENIEKFVKFLNTGLENFKK